MVGYATRAGAGRFTAQRVGGYFVVTFVFPAPKRVTRVTKQDDVNEIRRLLAGLSPDVRRVVEARLLGLSKSTTAANILAAMQAGRFTDALQAVDFSTLGATLGQELTPAMRKALEAGSRSALAQFPGDITAVPQIRDVLATEFAAAQAAKLVQDVRVATKAAIRSTITRTFTDGLSMADASKQIREAIGLSGPQATALQNFRRGLEEAVAGDRSLASLRGQYRLSRGILRGQRQLRPGNIDSLVNRYKERMVRHRAQTIAEHEVFTALQSGKQEMWKQLATEGAIDPQKDVQEWLVVADDRTCEICLPNHGVKRPLGQPFPSGDVAPPAHVGCRCDIRIVTPEVEALGTSEGRRRADRIVDERRQRIGVRRPPPTAIEGSWRAFDTTKEAEAWATGRVAQKVAYGAMDVNTANEMNRALNDMIVVGKRSPLAEIVYEPGGHWSAAASFNTATGRLRYFKGTTADDLVEELAESNRRARKDFGVRWGANDDVYETIVHEYGHAMHAEAIGFEENVEAWVALHHRLGGKKVRVAGASDFDEFGSRLSRGVPVSDFDWQTLREGIMSQPELAPSKYARSNLWELVAESWLAYHKGEKHLIPKPILEWIEEVI